MGKHAAKELLEPRLGQRPFEAPSVQRPDQHAGPLLAGSMKAKGGLLQPQRVDPVDSSGGDQCTPDLVLGFARAEVGEGPGQCRAWQAVALVPVDRVEHGGLMHDDSLDRPPCKTAGAKNGDLWVGRFQPIQSEQSARRSATDQGTSDSRRGRDCQSLLPCRRVASDNQRSADGFAEPATFFGESNVAGCEPKGGGLTTNDETMVRGRKLRHGPRGQNGHLPKAIGESRFVPTPPRQSKCVVSMHTVRTETTHFAVQVGATSRGRSPG